MNYLFVVKKGLHVTMSLTLKFSFHGKQVKTGKNETLFWVISSKK